ncbi:MAG: SGNH/GDSL hydrolase family protein [Rhodothermales bacterium]
MAWKTRYMPCLIALLGLMVGCSSEKTDSTTTPMQAAAPFQQGERIVFFGDSITEAGVQPGGYVALINQHLRQAYPDLGIEVIGAGISGNKVPDLLARVERDVLAHAPTLVVIYIGINDVWHWYEFDPEGTEEAVYEAGLGTLLETIGKAGARVLLCTPSVIGERHDGTNESDALLETYVAISRSVAERHAVPVCDLHRDFMSYLKEHNPDNQAEGILTTDGVHLNAAGNQFVAERILAALEAVSPE